MNNFENFIDVNILRANSETFEMLAKNMNEKNAFAVCAIGIKQDSTIICLSAHSIDKIIPLLKMIITETERTNKKIDIVQKIN